jgi:hypothetical protein
MRRERRFDGPTDTPGIGPEIAESVKDIYTAAKVGLNRDV